MGMETDVPITRTYLSAMAWLGEELPRDQQSCKTPFAPRCIKDRIEEGVSEYRRDLFTGSQLVIFDTTAFDFEGEGGREIGQRAFGKDLGPTSTRRSSERCSSAKGGPICCKQWPETPPT